MYLSATGAHTTNKNTPETDLLPEVMHTVEYTTPKGDSGTIQIMAKDPQDALRKVNSMTLNDLRLK